MSQIKCFCPEIALARYLLMEIIVERQTSGSNAKQENKSLGILSKYPNREKLCLINDQSNGKATIAHKKFTVGDS